MNIDITDVGLTTSDIILAAHQNRLYSGLKNISKVVEEIYWSVPEDLWDDEFLLNDLSIGGID